MDGNQGESRHLGCALFTRLDWRQREGVRPRLTEPTPDQIFALSTSALEGKIQGLPIIVHKTISLHKQAGRLRTLPGGGLPPGPSA
jgi:hypothetical protein